jgi:formate dehydrogenase subunit gamma
MSPKLKRFPRFDRTERVVHWTNATLFFILIATGASLKLGSLSTVVAHRHTVKTIHVIAGFLLPLPIIVAILLHSGRQFRRDLSRLNRWTDADRLWWSPRTRRDAQLGKFNPGQKLNAIFIGAVIVVMLMTGSILAWPDPFRDSWREGATFVHDSTWLVVMIVIAGHIIFATRDLDSLRSIFKGWVPESWARRERPAWWAEIVAARASSGDAVGDVSAGGEQRVDESGARAGEVPVVDVVDARAGDRLGGGDLE